MKVANTALPIPPLTVTLGFMPRVQGNHLQPEFDTLGPRTKSEDDGMGEEGMGPRDKPKDDRISFLQEPRIH